MGYLNIEHTALDKFEFSRSLLLCLLLLKWTHGCVHAHTRTRTRTHRYICTCISKSQDRAVSIATGYGLDDQGVRIRVLVWARIFTSPCHPDRLWGPPSLLSNGYHGLFTRGLSGRGVKLTTHLQLMPRSRKRGFIHPLPHMSSWHSA
jgi:hypothetical protein